MKKSNLINYNLFYSRNKFDPVLFIRNNNIDSYDKFCSLLEARGVLTPGLEYYNRVVNHINEKSKKELIDEKNNSSEKEKEIISVPVDVPKKSRRRRVRKKS
jgi:hypothetical protein